MLSKLRAKIEAFEKLHGGKNVDARRLHNMMRTHERILRGGDAGQSEDAALEQAHYVSKLHLDVVCEMMHKMAGVEQYKHVLFQLMVHVVVFWNQENQDEDLKYAYCELAASYFDLLGYFDRSEMLLQSPMGSQFERRFHDVLEALTQRNLKNESLHRGIETFLGGMGMGTKTKADHLSGSDVPNKRSRREPPPQPQQHVQLDQDQDNDESSEDTAPSLKSIQQRQREQHRQQLVQAEDNDESSGSALADAVSPQSEAGPRLVGASARHGVPPHIGASARHGVPHTAYSQNQTNTSQSVTESIPTLVQNQANTPPVTENGSKCESKLCQGCLSRFTSRVCCYDEKSCVCNLGPIIAQFAGGFLLVIIMGWMYLTTESYGIRFHDTPFDTLVTGRSYSLPDQTPEALAKYIEDPDMLQLVADSYTPNNIAVGAWWTNFYDVVTVSRWVQHAKDYKNNLGYWDQFKLELAGIMVGAGVVYAAAFRIWTGDIFGPIRATVKTGVYATALYVAWDCLILGLSTSMKVWGEIAKRVGDVGSAPFVAALVEDSLNSVIVAVTSNSTEDPTPLFKDGLRIVHSLKTNPDSLDKWVAHLAQNQQVELEQKLTDLSNQQCGMYEQCLTSVYDLAMKQLQLLRGPAHLMMTNDTDQRREVHMNIIHSASLKTHKNFITLMSTILSDVADMTMHNKDLDREFQTTIDNLPAVDMYTHERTITNMMESIVMFLGLVAIAQTTILGVKCLSSKKKEKD